MVGSAAWLDTLVEHIADSAVVWLSTETAALLLCFIALLWLACRLCYGCPRTCIGILGAWFAWVLLDIIFGRGWEQSIKGLASRGSRCFQAAQLFSLAAVGLFKALLDFLVPFVSDAARVFGALWQRLSVNQRVACLTCGLVSYSVLKVAQTLARNRSALRKAAFEISFLVVAPSLWFLCKMLPPHTLPHALHFTISIVPALSSFKHIWLTMPLDNSGIDAKWSMEVRRMWLSYWAVWPVLELVQAIIRCLPRQQDEPVPVTELSQVLLITTVWLQHWQAADHCLSCMRGMTLPAIGAKWPLEAAQLGGLWSPNPLQRLLQKLEVMNRIGKVQRKVEALWQSGSRSFFVALACLAILAGLLHKAVSLLTDILEIVLWFFGAAETTNVVFCFSEELYMKRLCFWVLAVSWDSLLALPLLHGALHWLTPLALVVSFVGGEHVLRWLLIPSVESLTTRFSMLQSPQQVNGGGMFKRRGGTKDDAMSV